MSKIPTCISLNVEVEEVTDETRAFPIKDAQGNPTDKMKDHRIVTASGYCKTTDGKRERGVSLKWFDPSIGTDLPSVGKPFVVDHFRSISESSDHGYQVQF